MQLIYIISIIILITLYYFYLSFIDWYIHKNIMHNDNSILLSWRKGHIIHHKEFNNKLRSSGISIEFTFFNYIIIGIISSLPLIIIGYIYYYYYKFDIKYIKYILVLHLFFIFIGVSIHNYSHSLFHEYTKYNDCFRLKIPQFLINILHNHHLDHHKNCKTNFCTVFLGFDNIIGTNFKK